MHHRICIILSLLFLSVYVYGNEGLRDSTQQDRYSLSILTYEPGNEVYAIFGHSAIRVVDNKLNTDFVYNYGIFDFDTPNFALKFVRGNLLYQLARTPYQYVSYAMFRENRSVYEQRLRLTTAEATSLVKALELNYLPENRYYLYDFFHDNCATRVHEIIFRHIDSTVVFDSGKYRSHTFRTLLDSYTQDNYWLSNGINILLGKTADEKMKPVEYMFIPDYVMEIYAEMQVKRDAEFVNLTTAPVPLFVADKLNVKAPFPWSAIMLSISIFLFIWSVWEMKRNPRKNKLIKFFDFLMFFIFGIVGVTLVALWLGSMHEAFENNWNILWLNPLYLVLAFASLKKYWGAGLKIFATLLLVVLLVVIIIGSLLLGQNFPAIALPIGIIIIGRILVLIKRK